LGESGCEGRHHTAAGIRALRNRFQAVFLCA
jgi:hypothetical protein